MEDRFGNGVVITHGSDGDGNLTWTLNDSLRERVITFEDQGPAFPRQRYLVSKIELPAFDTDTLATYTFAYATKTVNRPGAHTHPDPTDRSIDVRVLQKITLPDGSAYTMGSVANPAYRSEGYLTQIRLPTLGYLEWDWENYAFPKMRSLPPNQEEDETVEPFNSNFGVSKASSERHRRRRARRMDLHADVFPGRAERESAARKTHRHGKASFGRQE